MSPPFADPTMPPDSYPGAFGGALPGDAPGWGSFGGLPRTLVILGAVIGLLAPLVMMLARATQGFGPGWVIDTGTVVVTALMFQQQLGPVWLVGSVSGVLVLFAVAVVGVLAFLQVRGAPIVAVALGVGLLLGGLLSLGTGGSSFYRFSDWYSVLGLLVRLVVPAVLLLVGGIVGLTSQRRDAVAGAPGPVVGGPAVMGAAAMGGPQMYVQPGSVRPGPDGMGIASFVLSLLGLLLCGPLSIVGIVLGHMARGRTRQLVGRPDGFATAGTVIGWIGVLIWVVLLVGLVALNAASSY